MTVIVTKSGRVAPPAYVPVAPTATNDTFSLEKNATGDIDVLSNDLSNINSSVLTLTAVSNVTGGTASIINNKIRYVAGSTAGSFSLKYTMKNSDNLTSEGTVNITIREVTIPYYYAPPHYPTAASQVVVWDSNTNGGNITDPNDWTKYLLIVMPNSDMGGQIRGTGLHCKGIFIIGGRIKNVATATVASTLLAPSGQNLYGYTTFRLSFDKGGAAAAGVRPFIWVSNIESVNDTTNPIFWGPWIWCGTVPNDTYNNFADYNDLYVQKCKVTGHYYWTGKGYLGESTMFAHSDAPPRKTYLANIEATHNGSLFRAHGYENNNNVFHPDGEILVYRMQHKLLPANANVYGGNGWLTPPLILANAKNGYSPTAGNYNGVNLTDFYCESSSLDTVLTNYFSTVNPPISMSVASKVVTFADYTYTGKTIHVFGGSRKANFNLPSVSIISSTDYGLTKRVTTAQGLVDIFN